MGGISVFETDINVGSLGNAWSNFLTTTANGTESMVVTALGQLMSSATAFSKSPGISAFSSATGFAASSANFYNDLTAYQAAVKDNQSGLQTDAVFSMLGDGLGAIGSLLSASAAAVSSMVSSSINPLSFSVGDAAALSEFATIINAAGVLVGAVQTGAGIINGITSYFQELDDELNQAQPLLELNFNDPNSNSDTFVMPGQSGDSLVETPLSGSSAFQYAEVNSAGAQTSSVMLAMNGPVENESIYGTGVVSDVSEGQISLGNGASATLNGSSDAVALGQNTTTMITGGSNTFSANGSASGSTFTLEGTGANADTVNLAGATDVSVLLGDATTEAGFVSTSATVNSLNGGGVITGSAGDNLNILGVNVTLNANGGQYSLAGSGATANASNSVISVGADLTATVNGKSDTINALADSATALNGSGNIVNLVSDSGSTVGLYGVNSDNTIYGMGNSIGVDANNATVTSSGNTFWFSGTGLTTSITGSNNVVNGLAGSSTLVTGSDTVYLQNDSDSTVGLYGVNSDNTIYGTGNSIGVDANNATVTSSDNIFWFSNAYFTTSITGGQNVVNALADSSTLLSGSGNTVYLQNDSDSTVGLYGVNSDNTIYGTGNLIGVDANNATVTSSGNTFWFSSAYFTTSITGGQNVVNALADSSTLLSGSGNTVYLQNDSDSTVGLYGVNSDNTIYGTGNSIGVDANNATVSSSGNTFWFSGTGLTTSITGGQNVVNTLADSSTLLSGSGNTVYLQNDSVSTVGLYGVNSNNTINGTGNSIGIDANNATVASSGNTFYFSDGGFATTVNGSSNLIDAGETGLTTTLNGNSNVIDAGAASLTVLSGLQEVVNLVSSSGSAVDLTAGSQGIVYGTGNSVDLLGSNVFVYAKDDSISYSTGLSDLTVAGSGDSGNLGGVNYIPQGALPSWAQSGESGGSGGSGEDSGDSGDSGDGGGGEDDGEGDMVSAGFSGDRGTVQANLSSNITAIAQSTNANSSAAIFAATESGLAEAQEMANDAPVSAGVGPNVFEGARWSSETITWSIASAQNGAASPFSGFMGDQYESAIEQAFATWAAASGLNFVEVADSSQSDIRIGWGDLDTQSTSQVGQTILEASGGVFSSGATIQIEDPTQDDVFTDAGQPGVASTATLEQVLLHEIGHALGLADNADQSSIMNYDLTTANQSLDATDLNAIQTLYGNSAATAQLIQAMASLGTTSAMQTSAQTASQQVDQSQLLAANTH
jgi:predicted Zn-dependent protease